MKEEPSEQDFYERLNLTRSATLDEIRRTYHSLALNLHPDASSPAERNKHLEWFQYITEAYNTLSNPEKRTAYDKALEALDQIRNATTMRMPTLNEHSIKKRKVNKRATQQLRTDPRGEGSTRQPSSSTGINDPFAIARKKKRYSTTRNTILSKLLAGKGFSW